VELTPLAGKSFGKRSDGTGQLKIIFSYNRSPAGWQPERTSRHAHPAGKTSTLLCQSIDSLVLSGKYG